MKQPLLDLADDLRANAFRLAREAMIENVRISPTNLLFAASCAFLAEWVREWAERG